MIDVELAKNNYQGKDNVICIKDVYKSFMQPSGQIMNVLDGVDLSVNKQEFFSIIGPSGCGKSTIFNIIAGLLEPNSGSVMINSQKVNVSSGVIGYMMQKDLLLPWRTILQNVTLGLEIQHIPQKERLEISMEYLDRYKLVPFKDSYPSMLSGGMRQRVALIRTLVTNPEIIMLDEPFSALDYQTRLVLEDEILSILKNEKKTCILITHDIEEAVALSDRVAVMSKRPTKVKEVYDIGLACHYGSAMKARSAPDFKNYFNMIWDRLDIQMEGVVNG